jgi:hypothetical protein
MLAFSCAEKILNRLAFVWDKNLSALFSVGGRKEIAGNIEHIPHELGDSDQFGCHKAEGLLSVTFSLLSALSALCSLLLSVHCCPASATHALMRFPCFAHL